MIFRGWRLLSLPVCVPLLVRLLDRQQRLLYLLEHERMMNQMDRLFCLAPFRNYKSNRWDLSGAVNDCDRPTDDVRTSVFLHLSALPVVLVGVTLSPSASVLFISYCSGVH